MQRLLHSNRLNIRQKEETHLEISQLVNKAKHGNNEAFEQLIAIVRNKLYRTAFSYVQNQEDALDIYQDAIFEAYISLRKLKKPESFQHWITKILIFKAIDFIRKDSKHILTDNVELFTGIYTENNMNLIEHSLDLTYAFSHLSTNYKTLILLRYYHDLSIHEIADILNYPEGTIKSHLYRARQILKPILKEDYFYE